MILLGLYALLCVLPFVHIVASSLTSPEELLTKKFVLFPTEWSLDAYKYVFSTGKLLQSLGVTVFLTVVGTVLNVIFTTLMAYPLAKKELEGRRAIMLMVLFTMLFNGGMIPTFLLVKALGLLNSLWALIVPGLIGAFILIIMKNFFQQLPEGIEESAKIDGCHELGILFRIVIPLSLPSVATISLFYAVGHWNVFMSAILYLNKADLWPLQVLLRQVVLVTTGGLGDSSNWSSEFVPPPQTVRMAVIVVATVPILLVYPFIQKHFAKGALLGSVKG
ncbi:carbohydrate ABC transporter permease [Paenibacillus thalictri]|nr:carbohydrate ABC transporter permease [Paenibacillus thalictri]